MKSRMLKATLLVGSLIAVGARLAPAQTIDPQCARSFVTIRDACQKGIDMFALVAPQLGTSIAGGNAMLGQGGSLGGLPHFAISLRATGLQASVPDVQNLSLSVNGAQKSEIGINKQWFGVPAVDAALGLFQGFPVGVTNVGGIDLLGSALYVPSISENDVRVSTPDGSFKFGYGARVGILQESIISPGVSVTYMVRDLPTTDVVGRSNEDTIAVRGLHVKTRAWRVTASKSFIGFGLAAGGGQDRYESGARLDVVVRRPGLCALGCRGDDALTFDQTMTRQNFFANVQFSLIAFQVLGEIGRVSGGSAPTYNTFTGERADDARTYFSVAFRRGF